MTFILSYLYRILCILAFIIILTGSEIHGQVNFSLKAETSFLKYCFNTVQVDPGQNWNGYNLYEENGIAFNLVNGLEYKNKIFAGIGVGYLNFEGISGVSLFSDFEYLPLKTRLTPLVNLQFGYSHIWNQYENGTGTGLGGLLLGLNYKLSKIIDTYVKSGYIITQQSFLIPVSLGIRIRTGV